MQHLHSVIAFVMLGKAASMTCSVDSKGLKASFHKVSGANYYEVQIASSPNGPAFAAEASEAGGGYVHIYGAIKGKTYYVRLRSHAAKNSGDGPWRLLRGWSKPGSWYKCEYKESDYGNTTLSSGRDQSLGQVAAEQDSERFLRGNQTSAEIFNLGVVRQAHSHSSPDYLDEKNAGGYGMDADFAGGGGLIMLFCVEVMKVTLDKSKLFSYDVSERSHYANYVSCDVGVASKKDYKCIQMDDGDCGVLFDHTSKRHDDTCKKIDDNIEESKIHVGRGERYKNDKTWDNHYNCYSFPAKTECREHNAVGTKQDGVTCTWRRHNHFRLTTFQDGWGPSEMEKALHDVPLEPWKCSSLQEQAVIEEKWRRRSEEHMSDRGEHLLV